MDVLWGYRIFTMEVYDGRVSKGGRLPVDDVDGQHLASVLECLVNEHLQGDKSLRGRPKPGRLGPYTDDAHAQRVRDEVDLKRDPDRLLYVEKASAVDDLVTIPAESGKVNAHRWARSSTGDEPYDLRDRAAMRPSRSWFLVPTKGSCALVVAEVNGLSASLSSMINWLEVASGAERGGRQWRFRLVQLVDPQFVKDLLDPQRSAEVTLIKHGGDDSRSDEKATLKVQVVTAAQRSRLGRAIAAAREEGHDRKAVLKDLAGVVANADRIDFDDGNVTVEQDGGGTTTLDLFRTEDVFTYRIKADQRPSSGEYLAAAREVVGRMPELDGLTLPWPEQGD